MISDYMYYHNHIGDDADAGDHRRSSSFSNLEENFKKRMPIKRQGSLVHNEEQVWLDLYLNFMEWYSL